VWFVADAPNVFFQQGFFFFFWKRKDNDILKSKALSTTELDSYNKILLFLKGCDFYLKNCKDE
jgi:hypothetical protein